MSTPATQQAPGLPAYPNGSTESLAQGMLDAIRDCVAAVGPLSPYMQRRLVFAQESVEGLRQGNEDRVMSTTAAVLNFVQSTRIVNDPEKHMAILARIVPGVPPEKIAMFMSKDRQVSPLPAKATARRVRFADITEESQAGRSTVSPASYSGATLKLLGGVGFFGSPLMSSARILTARGSSEEGPSRRRARA